MARIFRKYLIVLLALLQLFAPLVHAHTGDHKNNQGLHIPGLEPYLAVNQHDLASQNVDLNKADWDAEGILIVVNAGIKKPHDSVTVSQDSGFTLVPYNPLQISALINNLNNFSPHPRVVFYKQLHSPLSPRAPPVQVS
jgi:hypothetical protein